MWIFAWRNLLTRPLRTTLALVGLSIPILGVLGLMSLSGGLRSLVGETLSKIQGLVVLKENAFSPVLSDLPANLGPKLRQLPGVTAVAPELWEIPGSIENRRAIGQIAKATVQGGMGSLFNPSRESQNERIQSMLDQPILQGQEIASHQGLKSAIFPRALKEGRFLQPGDEGTNRIVISRKIARDFADPKTREPKGIGDTLKIEEESFEIIGIYETGSILLDVIIIMDLGTLRRVEDLPEDLVSTFYVEAADPAKNEELSALIERTLPKVDARSPNEIMANFGTLMNQLDVFLLATVMLALLVGVVGIVNTMLMSTTERFAEFGVLRTNGWSRSNLLALVSAESAYLGLLAGLVGFALAVAFTTAANQFIATSGLSLSITPLDAAKGLGLSVAMGLIGGLYPAWKASRMVPMAAIRLGAH
jgi:putative ABC transport system permease protein